MSKFRFDLTQAGEKTIQIEADDGFLVDDWKELSIDTCLIDPVGTFKIEADKAVFSSYKVLNFILSGKPFDANVGDTGDATIDLSGMGCPSVGWTWALISKP